MNVEWERAFEFSHPVAAVWAAYMRHEGGFEHGPPPAGTAFELTDARRSKVEITEVVTHERLRWSQTAGDDRTEMTVTFESIETGTRITVTQYGFGQGDEFEVLRESQALGWTESMQDLAVYLATGVSERRHLQDRSATGIVLRRIPAGLEVFRVGPQSLGEQAGLRTGDVLLAINGAALYGRSDMWMLTRLLDPGTEVEIRYVRDGLVGSARGRMSRLEMAVTGELGLGPRIEQPSTA